MGAEDEYLTDIDAGDEDTRMFSIEQAEAADKDKLFDAFKTEFAKWGMWAESVVKGLGGTLPESYTPADLRELIIDLFKVRLQALCDCPRCEALREADGN